MTVTRMLGGNAVTRLWMRRRLSLISTNAPQLAVGAVLAGLTVLPVRSESLQERLPICFACHGQNGQSQRAGAPSRGSQQSMCSLIELGHVSREAADYRAHE